MNCQWLGLQEVDMRAVKGLLGAVMVGGVLFAANTAVGASAPMTGGAVQVWVTPSPTGNGGGKVMVTGALADYGTGQTTNAAGKADTKGTYKRLLLKHGTIFINATKFVKANNNANPTMYNKSDCSAVIDFSAPVAIESGTGAYAGITGSITLTTRYAVILPKTKTGACNESNSAIPLDQYGVVTGSGTIKFS
jgi:hypothetical protein